MLTNYVMCVPLAENSLDIVVNAYLRKIYCRFGEVENFYQTMGMNSKPHYLLKWLHNLVSNILTPPHIDPKQIDKLRHKQIY